MLEPGHDYANVLVCSFLHEILVAGDTSHSIVFFLHETFGVRDRSHCNVYCLHETLVVGTKWYYARVYDLFH